MQDQEETDAKHFSEVASGRGVDSVPDAGKVIVAVLGGLACLAVPPTLLHSANANPVYGHPLIPWFAKVFANIHFTPTLWSMAVLGFFLGYAQPRPWALSCCLTVVLPLLLHAANVLHDWTIDPTSHNLFPFEFAVLFVLGMPVVVGGWAGSVLGAVIEGRHARTRT